MSEDKPADILVVDDNPANLDLLEGMFAGRNYRLRVAASGRRALTAASAAIPDLLLLDITMPDMTGYEVCIQLEADPATQSVPVIFISALDSAIDKVRAFQAGGADYVTKPFQFDEVIARIEHQLQIARLTRELQEANRMLARLAIADGLTGVPNRRRFDEAFDANGNAPTGTAATCR